MCRIGSQTWQLALAGGFVALGAYECSTEGSVEHKHCFLSMPIVPFSFRCVQGEQRLDIVSLRQWERNSLHSISIRKNAIDYA